MSSRRGSFLSTKLHCSSCLPCPLYFEKFKPSEKLQEHENFAKDLEMFARHAKRTTINTEDVKLLARRSNSLLKYITDKSEEIAQINLERKAQKKKKSEDGSKNSRQPAEAGVVESEN
ncbi:centromere protein S isoform X6 [Gorilla gorilla gorilla]|uniref:centromere protein S isoform X6 n=1 Tax=Gorilla gorilla gorilla TaxID=9595 RepID=UPI0008F4F2CA|nr:centromere protein S isoform X4 [Gorilla gorilla gorilla]